MIKLSKIVNFIGLKCSNLGLIRVSDSLEDDITCLGVDSTFIYASSKRNIYAFRFGRKVCWYNLF